MAKITVADWEQTRAAYAADLVRQALTEGTDGAELLPPLVEPASYPGNVAQEIRRSTYATLRALQLGSPAWTALSLSGGWGNTSATWFPAGARVSATGDVELRGAITHGVPATVGLAATLPATFRPLRSVRFVCLAGVGACPVTIANTGTVTIGAYFGGGSGAQVDLSGVRFSRYL